MHHQSSGVAEALETCLHCSGLHSAGHFWLSKRPLCTVEGISTEVPTIVSVTGRAVFPEEHGAGAQ